MFSRPGLLEAITVIDEVYEEQIFYDYLFC